MSGVTEIAICYLKPGADPVGNPDSAEGKIMQDTLSLVLQQKGAQRAFAGKEEENPNVLRLFIDWDKVEDHIDFTKSEAYGPMVKSLGAVLDAPIVYFHSPLKPFPPTTLSKTISPMTEILTCHFDPSVDTNAAQSSIKKLISVIETNAPGYKGYVEGWGEELQENDKSPGGKSKVYIGCLGWNSKEEHMNFRETQLFKDNVHHILDAHQLKDVQMVHASLLEYHDA
ncbi:MAG: hypothetical protein M1831_001558 [Alyxoria varia]|nr:MAG: hypothetical protein M1831_001558 [Alyxoria varia]